MKYNAFTIETLKKIKDQVEFEECLCIADATCPNCGVVSKYYVILKKEDNVKEINNFMACAKKTKKKKTSKK
jgi:hypothetical protein